MVENVSYTKIGLTIRVSVRVKIYKNIVCDKGYFWNPVTCNCENGKYVESITGDPVVICDEIIDATNSNSTKTVPAKCTLTNFYISIYFCLLALLIAVSIYIIKHWAKHGNSKFKRNGHYKYITKMESNNK